MLQTYDMRMESVTIRHLRGQELVDYMEKQRTRRKYRFWWLPDEPILNELNDEREDMFIYTHNVNYRIARKQVNYNKILMLKEAYLACMYGSGEAKWYKCMEHRKRFEAMARVYSNVDRGPTARLRDVGYIYHNHKVREITREAKELGIECPYATPPRYWPA